MMTITYSEIWDLDLFFAGGSDSAEFASHLKATAESIEDFKTAVGDWQPGSQGEEGSILASLVQQFDGAARKLRQAGAYVSCLQAQDTRDKKAGLLRANLTQMSASLNTVLTVFDQKLASFQTEIWDELVQTGPLGELRFVLTERRDRAVEKLSEQEETAVNALSVEIGRAHV